MKTEDNFFSKMQEFNKEIDIEKFIQKPEEPNRINIDLDTKTIKKLRMLAAFYNTDKKNLAQAIINHITTKYIPELP
ncbi:hypothetical protein [Flagellimonas onchidii]|uniref:hypothetical protein n=1 Tax=Flagellimonas onchidii TaxID=2562684 RepID=UPI0010A67C65|nr:hypothetical protein [Allomuricauda onchidii]